ncbi:hypothetical protein [Streptomyces marispadix]|uniref:Uncharacterized protein n=1 Tax=Streptomyces marispadix TaxID=2922868 RepID=A0ABS9SYN3_9ACTN|nr:hypothetical protein [Streptomyces marispadix]MCH6161396.1 hypothetical protein [Streptomyces marispadix]
MSPAPDARTAPYTKAVFKKAPYATPYETALSDMTPSDMTATNPTAHVNRLPARGDAQ